MFAKDLPAGSSNRIEKVAIVGINGTIGKWFAKSLIDGGKHTVTAITRQDSKSIVPDGAISAPVNYDDEESLVEALKGQQALIVTLAVSAPKDTMSKLVSAAAKAGVPYVFPNWWAFDPEDHKVSKDVFMKPTVDANCQMIEKLGISKWILFSHSYWYEFSVSGSDNTYGFEIPNRKMTLIDDGNKKICTSTWPQCGRAMAALLSLPNLPQDENDKSTTVSQFGNGTVYFNSFVVSQNDMLASLNRVMGTTNEDWTITKENSSERYAAAVKELYAGVPTAYSKLLYTRSFYPDAESDYSHKLHNKLLDLPEEDLDTATKEAVSMANAGTEVYSTSDEAHQNRLGYLKN